MSAPHEIVLLNYVWVNTSIIFYFLLDTLRRNENKTFLEAPATDDLTQNSEECNETVEEHEQTIYKGILSTQIKLVKTFSLLTSGIGLSCQPILLYQLQVCSLVIFMR